MTDPVRSSGGTLTLAQAPAPAPAAPVAAPSPTPSQSVADRVRDLTSYAWNDWSVSQDDQRQVVNLLRTDPNLNATLRDLSGDANLFGTSSLTAVIKRVDDPAMRRQLIDVLATRSDAANATTVRGELDKLDTAVVSGLGGGGGVAVNSNLWQVRFNLVRAGVPTSGPVFDRTPYAGLVSSDPTRPFTGAGASGVDPTQRGVPLGDQLSMLAGDAATTQRYSNPVGSLPGYLASLPPGDRARQAELFLRQPIASPMGEVWGDRPPTRAQVIEVAARQYNLDPATLGAFLLAEQRDQSALEDAKDYTAVVNANHNGSVGLGQIVISTARNGNLFIDTVSPATLRQAGNPTIARLLSDDAVSIFAAARYLRQTADAGSRETVASLDTKTHAQNPGAPGAATLLPGFNPAAYAGNSATWPAANIVALGSEYTSRPWDGAWFLNWGNFVAEARADIVASRVFP